MSNPYQPPREANKKPPGERSEKRPFWMVLLEAAITLAMVYMLGKLFFSEIGSLP